MSPGSPTRFEWADASIGDVGGEPADTRGTQASTRPSDVRRSRRGVWNTFDTSTRDDAMCTRRRRLAAEQAAVLSEVRSALVEVRDRLGVRTAYVVGSLRSPALWHESSDVDVAVGGCSLDVLEVMKVLEDVAGRSVDVIDLDRHPSPEACVRGGLRVYG